MRTSFLKLPPIMNISKHISPPEECTGCALCANVCGHDAIRMEWSKEGFLVPQVDSDTCINCGACVKACPAQPEHLEKLRKKEICAPSPAAYGGWNADNETHLASSSGGIFTALAAQVFSAGGCVFGVVWENKDTAVYAKAENMEELATMRGSKYAQAVPGEVYRQVKQELKNGRKVLFCGTSCQAYALKRYLRKENENLILVDILCHGVPSRNLLKAYIRHYEEKEGKDMSHIQFRDKAGNWQRYHVRKHFTDGSTLSHCNREDIFMRLFVGDYALNMACYSCPHARFPRVGDITLGDFWGNIQKHHPEWPIANGIGSILGNTPKGAQLLAQLHEQGCITLSQVPLQELIEGQSFTYLRPQRTLHPQRQRALRLLSDLNISAAYKILIESIPYGPFRVRRNSLIHKAIAKIRNIIRCLLNHQK